MNINAGGLTGLLVSVLIATIPSTSADAATAGDTCVHLSGALVLRDPNDTSSSPGVMLVSLTDSGCTMLGGGLTVQLPDGQDLTLPVSKLKDGGGRSWRLPFSEAKTDAFVSANLKSNTVRPVAQLVLPSPHEEGETQASPITPTVLVAALGLLGTLIAAVLADCFSRRRERQTAALARNTMLFEKYEPAYRSFLATWKMATNPAALTRAFERLCNEAYVPARLITDYEMTINALASPNNDPAMAHQAAKRFYLSLSTVLESPQGFV